MDNCCQHDPGRIQRDSAYRKVLRIALAVNAGMLLFEIVAGLAAGSASLQADALDFLSDAANYAVSLFVVGKALRYRARASLLKGSAMGLLGLWVVGTTVYHAVFRTLPEAETMGLVGVLALISNGAVLAMLWAYRNDDSNMRSDRCPKNCEAQTTSPNGNAGADGMASIIAHELEEAATDPDLNAWYDQRGQENADKCAWTFGATARASNGSQYNLVLGGQQYLIQQNWVNASGGYCALSY